MKRILRRDVAMAQAVGEGIGSRKDSRAPDLIEQAVQAGDLRDNTAHPNPFSEHVTEVAKFAEIGQLATGFIHEINNPVACLRSNVSTLVEYLPRLTSLEPAAETTQEVHQILADMNSAVELLSSISRNLKSLAYRGHGAPEETDLRGCIEAALSIVAHELKYRVRVERHFAPIPALNAFPGLLIQLFVNLFVNAAQAIEGQGVIRIRTYPEAAHVAVEVSDTGPGIAPDHLNRLFSPFFTTKPPGVGLGLGLSISRQIVERHGGDIEVSSASGDGTTFLIKLPSDPSSCCTFPDRASASDEEGGSRTQVAIRRRLGGITGQTIPGFGR